MGTKPLICAVLGFCLTGAIAETQKDDRSQLAAAQAEITALRVQVSTLRAEIKELRATKTLTVNEIETATKTARKPISELQSEAWTRTGRKAKRSAKVDKHLAKAIEKVEKTQDAFAKKIGVSPFGPSQDTLKSVREGIKFVGTRDSPKWAMMDREEGKQVLGVVNCPCASAKGENLTEEDARKRILGQVGLVQPTGKVGLGPKKQM